MISFPQAESSLQYRESDPFFAFGFQVRAASEFLHSQWAAKMSLVVHKIPRLIRTRAVGRSGESLATRVVILGQRKASWAKLGLIGADEPWFT